MMSQKASLYFSHQGSSRGSNDSDRKNSFDSDNSDNSVPIQENQGQNNELLVQNVNNEDLDQNSNLESADSIFDFSEADNDDV